MQEIVKEKTCKVDKIEIPDFDKLYDEYADRILNLAYRITHDAELARDITQDVFVKVYQNLPGFQKKSDIFTWIYRIALNHIINIKEKEKRKRWIKIMNSNIPELLDKEKMDKQDIVYNPDPSAHEKIERQEREKIIYGIILSLPEKYKIPFILNRYEDMSYIQIAEYLELSHSAVETRIFRARKMLVKKIKPWLQYI